MDVAHSPASPSVKIVSNCAPLLSLNIVNSKFPEVEIGITNFFDYINSGGDRDALGNFLNWNIKKADVKSVSFQGVWYDNFRIGIS